MSSPLSKSPIVHRFLALATTCVLSSGASAQTAEWPAEWTADDAVSHALQHQRGTALLDARLQNVRAQVDETTALSVPSFALAHEQVFGDLNVGYVEMTAAVEHEFDPSGWRSQLRRTIPYRELALRSEDRAWRLEVAVAVRTSFYSVRHRQERARVLADWIARLQRGLQAVEARRKQGDVSLYESKRVERELEIARARQAGEATSLAEAWGTLEAWTSWAQRPAIAGELSPPPPPPPGPGPEPELELPELARLGALEKAFNAELDVWGSPFFRGWTVGAGYRYAEVGASTGHGFLISLSVPMTLWNTDRPRIARLRAQKAIIGRERALYQSMAERAERAARARLEQTREALASLPGPEHDAELTALVEIAYSAGEAPLIELLDALASETELRLARIDLQWQARRAAIDLDHRRGLGVPR